MSRTYTLTTYRGGGMFDDDPIEHEFVVTYSISKGRPATRIDPEEYPEVELITVEMDGKPYDGDDVDWLVTHIEENHDPNEEAADRADYLYEQRRDREMERDFLGDDE